MTPTGYDEEAYAIMVAHLSATWIEDAQSKMRPKAIRLRNKIAKSLRENYERGVKAQIAHEKECGL